MWVTTGKKNPAINSCNSRNLYQILIYFIASRIGTHMQVYKCSNNTNDTLGSILPRTHIKLWVTDTKWQPSNYNWNTSSRNPFARASIGHTTLDKSYEIHGPLSMYYTRLQRVNWGLAVLNKVKWLHDSQLYMKCQKVHFVRICF